jgi:hypothetical protein
MESESIRSENKKLCQTAVLGQSEAVNSTSDQVAYNPIEHVTMCSFHSLYITLCARGMAQYTLTSCDRKEPVSSINMGLSFTERYIEWINANRGGVVPVNGQVYNNEIHYI